MPIGKSDQRFGELHDDNEGAEEGFDLAKLKMVVGFFLRAPKRRPVLAIVLPAVALTLALALAAWLPRTYSANMRVIAHRNTILPEHEGSGPLPEPTAGVADEILKRDNLEGLVKNLDLVSRWDSSRPPALRFKDQFFDFFGGAMSGDVKARALVGALEQRIEVNVEQNAITITVDWPNPQVAFDVLNAAYKNFLDARAESEVNTYSERLRLLETRAQFAAQDVDVAIAELTKRELEHRRTAVEGPQGETPDAPQAPANDAAPQAAGPARAFPRPAAPDTSASDQTAHELEDVRAQIRAAEDERRRRVAEVEAQLSDAQGSLGPLHPTVLALQRKLDSFRESSPQLNALRATEKELVAKLAADAPAPSDSSGATQSYHPPPASTVSGVPRELRDMLLNRDDPPTAYARSKLQAASSQYNDILSRMQLAKIELDVARQSFAETYTVIRPSELPAKPRKPNAPLIVAGGFFAALLLVFLGPGARDLLTGRFLEPWQVENGLKIPVLGALPPPDSFRPAAPDASQSS